MISSELRHTFVSHTSGMNVLERKKSVRHLLKVYNIRNQGEKEELCALCAVRAEEV